MVIRPALPSAVPPPATATALRLDDMLDFLQSNEGTATLQSIKSDLQKAGVEFNSRHGPLPGGASPTDTFEGLVNHALEGSFLRTSQATVAIANAAIYAFAHAADAGGMVDPKLVAERLGPKANALFTQLQQQLSGPGGEVTLPSTRLKTKYAWLPKDVVTQVARSAVRGVLVERMPVLEEVTRLLGGSKKLAGLQMMAVQHLFPTTQTLFEELHKNGLDPKKTLVYGKNYSTNHDVMHRMRADGWNVPELSQSKLLINNPDGTSREVSPIGGYLQQMFEGVDPKEQGPKFLLLDEGGKILKALHEHFPQYAHQCVAVEQTDRGLQILEDMRAHGQELLCPVNNVARSVAKKQNESPMIGESVVHSTETALAALHPDLKPTAPNGKKEAVVVGYGAVGKAVADALRMRGYQVFVHDIDPAKMEQARADGCSPGTREETLKHGHLLYSCTGRTTMKPEEFDKLLPDKAILVNAASGNHELGMDAVDVGGSFLKPGETFDEMGWRKDRFDGKELRLGDIAGVDEMCSCVVRGEAGSERLMLRSGYVVNMVDDIPPEYIQLTRSLLLAACLQASQSHGKVGLQTLDENAQQLIVSRTKKHLSTEGHDLLRPDFRKLDPAET